MGAGSVQYNLDNLSFCPYLERQTVPNFATSLKYLLKCSSKKSSKRHLTPYLHIEFFNLSNQFLRLQGNKKEKI